jgi:hypothetical protein
VRPFSILALIHVMFSLLAAGSAAWAQPAVTLTTAVDSGLSIDTIAATSANDGELYLAGRYSLLQITGPTDLLFDDGFEIGDPGFWTTIVRRDPIGRPRGR